VAADRQGFGPRNLFCSATPTDHIKARRLERSAGSASGNTRTYQKQVLVKHNVVLYFLPIFNREYESLLSYVNRHNLLHFAPLEQIVVFAHLQGCIISNMTRDVTEYSIRPNAAYHRNSWRWLFLGLVIINLGIALRLAWLGFWMILPFAVLDILAVMLVVYLMDRRSYYVEKIRITEDQLEIQHIQKGRDCDWQFPLYFARVELREPQHRWYPHRLLLGSSGEWVEVGSCLTDDERIRLAKELRLEIRQTLELSRQPDYT